MLVSRGSENVCTSRIAARRNAPESTARPCPREDRTGSDPSAPPLSVWSDSSLAGFCQLAWSFLYRQAVRSEIEYAPDLASERDSCVANAAFEPEGNLKKPLRNSSVSCD